MTDTITVIRARGGKRLAKPIRRDGRIGNVDFAYRFDLIEHPLQDFEALGDLLCRLIHRPDCAVVRGAVIDPARAINVRRLAYRDDATGDEPTLCAAEHQWLSLDMERIERPRDVPAADLVLCAVEAVKRLPAVFHGVRCIAQATAGHGLKPDIRIRLWYWLERPVTGAELIHWLHDTPADPAVFRSAQPIFTGAPIFVHGATDHLPYRMATLRGSPRVPVPAPDTLKPRRLRPLMPRPQPGDTHAARYAFRALTNAAVRVRQAGTGTRHATLLREARGLARFVDAGLLSVDDIAAVLHGAGYDVGTPAREIASVLAWAITHPSCASLPQVIKT